MRIKTLRDPVPQPMGGLTWRLQPCWQSLVDRGNAYVAQVERGMEQQVWLDSFRDAGSKYLIVGTF